jgi:hypothetical protein
MVEEEEENKNIVIRKIEGYLKEMAELSKVTAMATVMMMVVMILPVSVCI